MITKETMRIIKGLPKVDLHVHLDGSVHPQTVLELAKKQQITLPKTTLIELKPYLEVNDACSDLSEYLNKFNLVAKVLHTKEALERVAYELVARAKEQNYKYIEVRFGPQLHRDNGLSVSEVMESVIKGLTKGELTYRVKARAIACCMRHQSTDMNKEVIRAAGTFLGKGLVGVDLAGDESAYPTHLFRDVFALANQYELPVTIHAGEASGADNIKEAILNLGASRIGHGVRLKDDEKLFKKVVAQQIPLEMCPISNIQTKAADSWETYPIRDYFDQGVKVTVHTDNITVSNTTLSKEFAVLMEHFNFSIVELNQLTMNAIDASFLDYNEKIHLKNSCIEEYKRIDEIIQLVV